MPAESCDTTDETPATSVASVVAKRGRGRPRKTVPDHSTASSASDRDDDLAEERRAVAAQLAKPDSERLAELERVVGEIYEIVSVMADSIDDDRKARGILQDGGVTEIRGAVMDMLAAVRHGNELVVEFAASFRHLSNVFVWGGQLSHARFSAVLRSIERFLGKQLAAQRREEARPMSRVALLWYWSWRAVVAVLAGYGLRVLVGL